MLNTPQEKQIFIQYLMKAFYDFCQYDSLQSDDFLNFLKENPNKQFSFLIEKMTYDKKDDKYGIITLKLEARPSDLEFRLKSPSAYGGPKTEHYFDRIDLKIKAAKEWVERHPPKERESRIQTQQKLETLGLAFKKLIAVNCPLDHTKLNILSHEVTTYFKQQYRKAKEYLAVFMQELTHEILPPGKKSKEIKKELYQIEREMMSNKRPERITIRQIDIKEKKYYEANITTPVDTQRTISSAKKDEIGIANWLKSNNYVYSDAFELLNQRETYRSASIVPHELIYRSTAKVKSGGFTEKLVSETTRRNLVEYIIPELTKQQYKKNPNADPIKINFEMLTLISPIVKILEKFLDPDKTQFETIRDAFNYCNGIKNFSVMIGEQHHSVEFNGIYHNYGVNRGRGYSLEEKMQNAKAFIQVLDRSKTILGDSPVEYFSLLEGENEKSILNKIGEKNKILKYKYREISLNAFADHNKLLSLHTRYLNEQLSPSEEKEYFSLRSAFLKHNAKIAKMKKNISQVEEIVSKLYYQLAKGRISKFKKI